MPSSRPHNPGRGRPPELPPLATFFIPPDTDSESPDPDRHCVECGCLLTHNETHRCSHCWRHAVEAEL